MEPVLSKETLDRIINFIEVIEKNPEIKEILDKNIASKN